MVLHRLAAVGLVDPGLLDEFGARLGRRGGGIEAGVGGLIGIEELAGAAPEGEECGEAAEEGTGIHGWNGIDAPCRIIHPVLRARSRRLCRRTGKEGPRGDGKLTRNPRLGY